MTLMGVVRNLKCAGLDNESLSRSRRGTRLPREKSMECFIVNKKMFLIQRPKAKQTKKKVRFAMVTKV